MPCGHPFFLIAIFSLLWVGSLSAQTSGALEKPRPIPLALDDAFSFRKQTVLLVDPAKRVYALDEAVNFEQERVLHGAVTNLDRRQRYGHYFVFYWRAARAAELTLRLEYRHANYGDYVLAQEISYQGAKGSKRTEFRVIGDDYAEGGQVTSWRCLIIEKGRAVAFAQSYLWN